jgi:hypothetical protein
MHGIAPPLRIHTHMGAIEYLTSLSAPLKLWIAGLEPLSITAFDLDLWAKHHRDWLALCHVTLFSPHIHNVYRHTELVVFYDALIADIRKVLDGNEPDSPLDAARMEQSDEFRATLTRCTRLAIRY